MLFADPGVIAQPTNSRTGRGSQGVVVRGSDVVGQAARVPYCPPQAESTVISVLFDCAPCYGIRKRTKKIFYLYLVLFRMHSVMIRKFYQLVSHLLMFVPKLNHNYVFLIQ